MQERLIIFVPGLLASGAVGDLRNSAPCCAEVVFDKCHGRGGSPRVMGGFWAGYPPPYYLANYLVQSGYIYIYICMYGAWGGRGVFETRIKQIAALK